MADEKPFIEPNSGRSSQPGGAATYAYELPPTEQKDLSDDVKSQIQDDPEGLAAIDPDQQTTVPEPLLKKIEEEQAKADEETTARTGEVKDGTGKTIVSEDQAKESGVSPSNGGDAPVSPQEKGSGDDPSKAPEPDPVPTPEQPAPKASRRTTAAPKDS